MIPFKKGIVVNKNPLTSHRRSKGRSFRVALFLLQNVSVGLHICPSFADCGGQCSIVTFPELDNVLCEPLLLQNLSIGLVLCDWRLKRLIAGVSIPALQSLVAKSSTCCRNSRTWPLVKRQCRNLTNVATDVGPAQSRDIRPPLKQNYWIKTVLGKGRLVSQRSTLDLGPLRHKPIRDVLEREASADLKLMRDQRAAWYSAGGVVWKQLFGDECFSSRQYISSKYE